jgi:hypothetical protein
MPYVIATTEDKVRWYSFEIGKGELPIKYTLLEQLDLNLVPKFADKETAKTYYKHLGIKTCRYVKI